MRFQQSLPTANDVERMENEDALYATHLLMMTENKKNDEVLMCSSSVADK